VDQQSVTIESTRKGKGKGVCRSQKSVDKKKKKGRPPHLERKKRGVFILGIQSYSQFYPERRWGKKGSTSRRKEKGGRLIIRSEEKRKKKIVRYVLKGNLSLF